MGNDINKMIEKIASLSDGELRSAVNSIAENLDLKGKNRMIAKKLAANPGMIRSKLAQASPDTIASIMSKLTDEQKRELEKHIGEL